MSTRGYRDGGLWVVVRNGMPEHNVEVGVGETLLEARESLESTPIQSVGPDGGMFAALRWAHNAGWVGDLDGLEPEEIDDESEES